MMALQMLVLLAVVVVLFCPAAPYPVYGTKRYGGSVSWPPYHQMVRAPRYPLNYYEFNPFSQSYPDEYYQPETYPVYYSPARTSKYEVYQAVLPYFYASRPSFDDGLIDFQEEAAIQEAEREQREDAQPIGHELLYENEDLDNFDDVNAAFLQNLIASEMYRNAAAAAAAENQKDFYDEYYTDDYNKWETHPKDKTRHRQEDEDVRELKQLAKPKNKGKGKNRNKNKQQQQHERTEEDVHWLQRGNFRNNHKEQTKNIYEEKRDKASTQAPTLPPPKRDARGQKEEVLMRPATPVRHPFSSPVLDMITKDDERKRTPSVYDTIKHMLDMEKSLENKYGGEIRPRMKKRYVTSEEDLIHQLNVLKKQ